MTPDPDPPSCIGVLLAAGAGSRYRQAGGAGNKLHATLADGMPIAAHAAARLSAAVARVVALVAPDDAFLARRLADLGCVVLPAPAADGPEGGMGSTLAAAMQWLLAHGDGHTHALVALGDMPWVAPETLRAVAAQPSAHAVAAPLVQGRRGHPVRFARALWPELAALRADVGGREILRRHGVHAVPLEDPGALRDVDVPQDLNAA
ncbi:nucleotidyltransferase family protein [Achromobacter pulmonis]|uniref:Nucleotidyltransferase family protein n=2 Tax=Achromobacter pulmonis TaxID=1389932 RepID=A0A2N8KK30_9BURK|nr:nucleotidyltransferase family protein [Achromobacter pulmonis]